MPEEQINNKYLEKLLALADKYDKLGLYHKADKIYSFLKTHLNSLPLESRTRVEFSDYTDNNSMSSTEYSKGYEYLRGHPAWRSTGKGQALYDDFRGLALDTK